MADFKAAIIGCGGRANCHAGGFQDVEDTDLVAVADLDKERADAFAEKYSAQVYYDAEKMLDEVKPDIVSIVTREHPRRKLTVMCAEAGVKGIIAEKPMARTLAEAYEMVEKCEEKNCVLTVCQQMRFCTEFIQAREILSGDEIGRPYFMRATCYGALMEQGPHMIDMILYVIGDRKVVSVMAQVDEVEKSHDMVHPCPVFTVGYLKLDDDTRVVIESGRTFPKIPEIDSLWLQKRLEALGTEGMMDVVVANYCKVLSTKKLGWQVTESSIDDWNAATPRFIEELCQVLRSGGEHRNGGRESLAGFEIITALYQSVLSKSAVELPVDRNITPLEEIVPEQ
ncbi:MAG: Gfo/Idh/MocA family oxidoreductase [Planctomycetes bacterium]|nr:Gfo/Idh/MocA family oxidoreductase [Planctomycetota bacterium]